MEGVEAFLFFLALRGEAKREEVRARFPRLVPLLKALGEAVEVQGETFRLAKPLRLSWFAPLFRARYSPLLPEEERALALERLVEAAFRSAEAGEPLVDGEGLLKAARLFQAGSQALLKGDHREALHRLGEALGLLEKEGLPFPAAALALLSGPSIWLGILSLAITWAIYQGIQSRRSSPQPIPDSSIFNLHLVAEL